MKTVIFTKATSKTTRDTALVSANSVLEPSTRVIGKTIGLMEMVYFSQEIMNLSRPSLRTGISMLQVVQSTRRVPAK